MVTAESVLRCRAVFPRKTFDVVATFRFEGQTGRSITTHCGASSRHALNAFSSAETVLDMRGRHSHDRPENGDRARRRRRIVPSRREFIQAGIAASVLPGVTGSFPRPQVIYRVVSDVRYVRSAEFGLEAARLGASVVRIRGDITDFWFNDLSLRWKEQPLPVAGLTAQGPLFCLERLAWDHGMRVVFRGEHRLTSGATVHSLSGSPDALARAGMLARDSAAWARGMAHVVMACAAGPCQTASADFTTPVDQALAATGEPLVSWVIAPHRPVQDSRR